MNLPVQDLRGPHADEAMYLLAKAETMTVEQAWAMSDTYVAEDDPLYSAYTTEVWNALEKSGRLLPLGWFEAIFADAKWNLPSCKALHAVADAVVATLVRNEVSRDAYMALTLPFCTRRSQADVLDCRSVILA